MVLLSPTRTRYVKVLWDGWDLYGFSSLYKKTRKSSHSQMSLHKRQQFLLRYLKTLSVGPGKVWIRDFPSADQCSPKWDNQVVIKTWTIGRHINRVFADISIHMSVECYSHMLVEFWLSVSHVHILTEVWSECCHGKFVISQENLWQSSTNAWSGTSVAP